MEPIFYTTTLCMSVKSKGSNVQCQHFPKNGSEYCGIHSKSKNLVRIDTLSGAQNSVIQLPLQVNTINPTPDNINQVKKLCEKLDIVYDPSNHQRSQELANIYLSDLSNKYGTSIAQIIKIQSAFRMWNIYRRNRSNNKEDCGTMDSIYDIPIEYYFDYLDQDGFVFSFDIRTLTQLNGNPYNQKEFPTTKNFTKRLESKIDFIKKSEKKIKHDAPKLTEEQKFSQFLIRVFQKFDMIGQYTDTAWFENLQIDELKLFYKNAFDMFDYRAQLSDDIRKRIVKDGKLFTNIINEVGFFRVKHKRLLQLELLKEFERIIDEGEDKEYKILGVNLVLTVLVELCPSAAMSLPHLVQSSFGY